jgi:DNA-binding response OmpR family regulator
MSNQAPTLTGRRVLIAEDEYLIARDLEHMLVDAGCAEVTVVPSIEACTEAAAARALDAVVLDLRLQDGDAGELARSLRAKGLPVVFITGYEEAAIPSDLADLPLLAKPFPRRQLVNALAAVLQSHPAPSGDSE